MPGYYEDIRDDYDADEPDYEYGICRDCESNEDDEMVECTDDNRCEECTYCARTRPCECGRKECQIIGGSCEHNDEDNYAE